jgi:hypothetical protein
VFAEHRAVLVFVAGIIVCAALMLGEERQRADRRTPSGGRLATRSSAVRSTTIRATSP